MQLRCALLIVALLAVCSTTCSAGEGAQVAAVYRHYEDPTVTVSTPRVEARVALPSEVRVGAHWTADVITAATPLMNAPDVITRATEFEETRHQAGLELGWNVLPTTALAADYTISSEPDYLSQGVSVRVERELLERMAGLSVTGRLQLDQVGRVDIPVFAESMRSISGLVSWKHILHPHVVAHLAYSIEHRSGFQANPYRYVPLASADGMVSPEVLPRRRTRHAWEGLALWAATERLFLRAGYRLYADDWAVWSHTITAEGWRTFFADRVRLRLRLRGYTQSGAAFHQDEPAASALYYSGDYRLGPMDSVAGGARVDLRLSTFALMLGYDATYYRFHDNAFYPDMLGRMLSIGLTKEWP